jgi:hypothetical protein
MVSEINKECKSSLNLMRTQFYQLFCSKPWYVIGVIIATIVIVRTCIQAYTFVILIKCNPIFRLNKIIVLQTLGWCILSDISILCFTSYFDTIRIILQTNAEILKMELLMKYSF